MAKNRVTTGFTITCNSCIACSIVLFSYDSQLTSCHNILILKLFKSLHFLSIKVSWLYSHSHLSWCHHLAYATEIKIISALLDISVMALPRESSSLHSNCICTMIGERSFVYYPCMQFPTMQIMTSTCWSCFGCFMLKLIHVIFHSYFSLDEC